MQKTWTYKNLPLTPADHNTVSDLQASLNISHPMALMLWQRGIKTFEEARYFFRPELKYLHDPFLMKDMTLAVDRLDKAIKTGEKILIYGDYDVDGTTAVAMVYDFLRKINPNVDYYNPDRYKEGYGVSIQGIEYAHEHNITLIISLDCGIKSVDKVTYSNSLGIDFIVCDHHEPGDELPPAVAVLDPKRKDCPYPYKELTGNGIGLKLISAWTQRNQMPISEIEQYFDLAMVSIGSDIVPITGENRILAYYGLNKLNTNPRIGLKALMDVSGFQGDMDVEAVVFTIGPRINAAGRISHAKAAVQLLLEEDYDKALELAYNIQAHNSERRGLDSSITDQAIALINQDQWLREEACTTVLYHPGWHKGVIGIVASRCIEQYYRPTIIFTQTSDSVASGSARSVAGFDLYSALEECSEYLIQYGGHMFAAGMTIELDKLDAFRKAFDQVVRLRITEQQLTPNIDVDLEIDLNEMTPKFYRIMKQMAPFGPQNMKPVFVSHNLRAVSEPRVLKEKHLKLEVSADAGLNKFPAIGFNLAEEFYNDIYAGKTFSMVYSLEENTFRGNTNLQLFIRDIKITE